MGDIFSFLDRILPDPLKDLDDAIAVARFGRGVKLTWESGAGWNGADVEMLLNKYGIRAYARQYANRSASGEYGCQVPAKQARWAERVCRQAGVPLTGPLIDESNRNVQAGQGMPREWGAPVAPVGLAGMFGGIATAPKATTATQRRQARKSQRRQRRGTR